MRGSGRGADRPVGPQADRQFPGIAAAAAALQQDSDDGPHHVTQEGTGGHLDAEQLPARLDQDARDGPNRGAGRACDQSLEVVLADEAGGGGAHRLQLERARDVIGVARQQGAALAPVQDRIDVRALASGEARGKLLADLRGIAHGAVARQQRTQRDRETLERKGPTRRKGRDLTARVHARIGTPGARELDRLLEQLLERGLERASDGPQRGLPLKSAELGTVILDGEAQVD